MKQFFSKVGCPKAPQNAKQRVSLFPYLNLSGLTADERFLLESKLLDDTKRMIHLYADTELSIITSLEKRGVSLSSLKNFVENLVRNLSSNDDTERLHKSKDIYNIFFSLFPFKSFFNYEILEKIVKKFGSEEERCLMKEYISQFTEFCKCSVFEVPPNIFHDSDAKPGDRVFSAKLTKEGLVSLGDVVAARRKIADILDIDVVALQLCSITEGCVCLTFLIPGHIYKKIFPLSQSQESTLSELHMKVINDSEDEHSNR